MYNFLLFEKLSALKDSKRDLLFLLYKFAIFASLQIENLQVMLEKLPEKAARVVLPDTENFINLNHELVQSSEKIDGNYFEQEFSFFYFQVSFSERFEI